MMNNGLIYGGAAWAESARRAYRLEICGDAVLLVAPLRWYCLCLTELGNPVAHRARGCFGDGRVGAVERQRVCGFAGRGADVASCDHATRRNHC